MKAFNESFRAIAWKAGLILLFDGEVGPTWNHDEHNQADILTSGFEPRSRLPTPLNFLASSNSGLIGSL